MSNAVSNSEGLFSLPSLAPGTYTVTVTLQGFKTVVIQNVVLTSGAGANVKASMEVGGVSEQVTVSSSSEIVQTQSSTVSTTINTNQITKLPMTSRSAMDFVNLLPGVSTPSGNRDATINGLPRGTINITLDGVNIQDNTLRSTDGFFAIVSPRLDAIEEVTVQTATQGADSAGQGAVQIKFVTARGTNNFSGSGYEYYRSDKLNANTWFNNRNGVAKPKLKQNQFGARVRRSDRHPGAVRRPQQGVLLRELRRGPAAVRHHAQPDDPQPRGAVGRLQLSRRLDQRAGARRRQRPDRVGRSDDRQAARGHPLGDRDDGLDLATPTSTCSATRFNVPVESMRRYPTARVDYNFTNNHRFTSTYNYQKFTDYPDTLNNFDPTFPGFPAAAGQTSIRKGFSNAMRSTLGRNLVNEARVGYSSAPVKFFDELNTDMFSGSVANQGGFAIQFPNIGSQLTTAGPNPAPQSRNATSLLIEDTVTLLKGSHTFTMGGSFTQFDIWANNGNLVPRVTMGVLSDRSRVRAVHRGQLPGRVHGAAQRGARPLRVPHRPCHADHGRRAPRFVGDLQLHGRRPPGRAAARVRRLPAGPVAREVEPDGQRGRPLRHSESLLREEQQLHLRRHDQHLRRVRASRPTTPATCSSPGRRTPVHAAVPAVEGRLAVVQRRLQQHRADHRGVLGSAGAARRARRR